MSMNLITLLYLVASVCFMLLVAAGSACKRTQ